jgi:hypothetical protein
MEGGGRGGEYVTWSEVCHHWIGVSKTENSVEAAY